jgi:hypothetical protein
MCMSFSVRLKSKFESYAQIFTNNDVYHIVKACNYNILEAHLPYAGYAVVQLVEALGYKSEGRRLDS